MKQRTPLKIPVESFIGAPKPVSVGDKYNSAKATIDRVVSDSSVYKPKIEQNLSYVTANNYPTSSTDYLRADYVGNDLHKK